MFVYRRACLCRCDEQSPLLWWCHCPCCWIQPINLLPSRHSVVVTQWCHLYSFITSAEEGGYVFGSVCLSVCPSDYSQTCEWIMTNFWRGRAWLKDQVIQFWWRSGSRFGSGSLKSEIRILRIGGGLCSLSTSSFFFCFFKYMIELL